MRNFIAISTNRDEQANALRYLGTSTEKFCFNSSGTLTSKEVLDFLFSLHSLTRRKEYKSAVFVWYAAHLDVEIILKDLPARLKDIAFPDPATNRAKETLRETITKELNLIRQYVRFHKAISEGNRKVLRSLPVPCKTKREALAWLDSRILYLERRVKKLRGELHALEFIYWQGYRLRVRAGKSLTIYREEKGKHGARKGLTVYDLIHFFDGKPLPVVSNNYLGFINPALKTDTEDLLPLWRATQKAKALEETARHVRAEADTIKLLAHKLDDYLSAADLKLTRWYGASSAVNTLLRKWEVRKELRNYTEENTPRALFHAIESAAYGGRIETAKLGTLPGVLVYDLNSAFAYAVSLLPQLNTRWRFTTEYNIHDIFALWFIEYDLPQTAYLGMLPHRDGSAISYRRSGRGWYYAPEVRELMRRYPDAARVRYGYVLPYARITFGERIEELYQHRLELIAREGKGKGEKIFKSMLHCFYGKFGQTVGQAVYACKPWAGWITSFVRAQMLEAIEGQERDVIYMHTDAIHATQPLQKANVSDRLGEWELTLAPYGLYIQSGLHFLLDERKRPFKMATRGFEHVDYDRALEQLNERGSFEAMRQYFVGWRLAQEFPVDRAGDYLRAVDERLEVRPQEMKPRRFRSEHFQGIGEVFKNFDWANEWIDSEMLERRSRAESGRRTIRDWTRRESMMLDVVSAGRG